MESREGVPDDVWRRARRIWVTELESCPRQRQYRLQGEESLGSHFVQVRGSVSHQIIEQIIKGETIDPDFSQMPEAKLQILEEVDVPIKNLREWLETTDIDLSEAESEVSLETPLRDGYVLVGKIDLLTPEYIIDFKSGSKRNTKEYRTQLVAYNEMMKKYDGVERELRDVFLGGEKAIELNPWERSKSTLNSDTARFERLVDARIKHTEHILKGETVPCELSFTCAFCRYRHICRGL